MEGREFSYTKQTWKRLKKNKGAVFGLMVIGLTVFLALFGYLIAPDNSPNADLQTVEIQAKKPGYTQEFLKVQDPLKKEQSILSIAWQGKTPAYQLVPIMGKPILNPSGDSLVVNRYIDDGIYVSQSFALKSIAGGNSGKTISDLTITKKYWLGTDKFGRDILSRLIIGTRVSLAVGFIAVIISLTLGVLLGALAGYYRKKADAVIMWLVNVTWSIPTVLLVFAITMALGKGFWQVFIAVGITLWVSVARLVRGQVMAIRELEYVQAARAIGASHSRIILRHILPNIAGPILVIAAGNFATAIMIEAGLSFLGIGIQPPQPSWGLMIKENYNFIITNNPMLAIIPGLAIMLLVLAFNLLGNGLRDAIDVKE